VGGHEINSFEVFSSLITLICGGVWPQIWLTFKKTFRVERELGVVAYGQLQYVLRQVAYKT